MNQISICIEEKRKGHDLVLNSYMFSDESEDFSEKIGCFFATELPYLSGRIAEAFFSSDPDLEFRSYRIVIFYGNKGVSKFEM